MWLFEVTSVKGTKWGFCGVQDEEERNPFWTPACVSPPGKSYVSFRLGSVSSAWGGRRRPGAQKKGPQKGRGLGISHFSPRGLFCRLP